MGGLARNYEEPLIFEVTEGAPLLAQKYKKPTKPEFVDVSGKSQIFF